MRNSWKVAVGIVIAAVMVAVALPAAAGEGSMTMTVESPAFSEGQTIPARYTADGADISPPLVIHGVPGETRSLALIMDDPDAPMGTWVHWVAWNLPAETREIPEGSLPGGTVEGRNSWGRAGYGGPAPPSGTHRYYFKVYALDTKLDLPPSTDKAGLLSAMKGHVLAEAELMGRYSRNR